MGGEWKGRLDGNGEKVERERGRSDGYGRVVARSMDVLKWISFVSGFGEGLRCYGENNGRLLCAANVGMKESDRHGKKPKRRK
jgi:hypothetical protein